MTHPYAHIDVPDESALDLLLDRTKGRLFFKKGAGFLGSLVCDHRYIWDDEAPTAWCNGETIGWNPQFFMWLTPEERVTVLAHELWHTGFDHMSRLYERCPDIWNQAADHVINNMLQEHGFVFGDNLLSLGLCLDPQFKDMSTEEVYDKLPKPPSGQPNPNLPPDPNGPPAQGSSGQGHKGMSGDIKAPPKGTNPDDIKGKLVKAAQASRMSKEAGIIPGETELIIDEFLNPILPWEVLLQRFFTDLSNDDYSWKRPSRRYEDEYLPSLSGENGLEHLIYYLDVSGSVSDGDVLRFNSEVKHIHESLRPKRLTLVTFDTKIQDTYEFEQDMPFDKVTLHGRGGTSLEPVRQHIIKNKPTAAVIFSDLYVRPMTPDPQYPILWVVVGNKRAKPAFGQAIHIDCE